MVAGTCRPVAHRRCGCGPRPGRRRSAGRGRAPPTQVEMALAVGDVHHLTPAPRGPGRHGQKPGLCDPGPAVGLPGGGGDRHQGAAGPAGHQGSAVCWPNGWACPCRFAVLKGRSNYLCRQRASGGGRRRPVGPVGGARMATAGTGPSWAASPARSAAVGVVDHGRDRRSGRSGVRTQPSGVGQVSVSSTECPGAAAARRATCASPRRPGSGRRWPTWSSSTPTSTPPTWPAGGHVLPDHDLVIFDEAHELEDIASSSLGPGAGAPGGSSPWPATPARSSTDRPSPTAVEDGGTRLGDDARARTGARLRQPAARRGRRRSSTLLPRTGQPAEPAPAPSRPRRPGPQGPGPAGRRPSGRRPGPCAGASGQPRRLGRGLRPAPVLRVAPIEVGTAARRPAVAGRGGADRGADQRHHPARLAARIGLPDGRRRARRRQPVRLPAPGSAVLRRPPARSPLGRLRGGHARGAGGAGTGRRGPDAGAVHQLAGHAGGRPGAAPRPAVDHPDPVRPAQAGACRGVPARGAFLPVRHHGLLAGRRRARARRCRWSPSTASRSPGPTNRCCRPAGSAWAGTPSASSTYPGPPPCWPRARAG